MLPKRICWLLISLLIISASVIITTRYGKGQNSAAPGGPRMKVLRRKDQLGLKPTRQEIDRFQGDTEERKLKTKTFKDMPLEVRAVKNLQSDTWHKDLEIEVKNISTKPIYFILAYLIFPDVPAPGNGQSGIHLYFGDTKNVDVSKIADPQDPHIDPGETFILTIAEQFRKGLKVQHERSPELMKKLELRFSVISFGDGTGFEAGGRLGDYRIKKSHPDSKKNHRSNRLATSASVRSPPQDGCGPCGRYVISLVDFHSICYGCLGFHATTSPDRPCRQTTASFFDCDGDGIMECPDDDVYDSPSCPGSSPTPTPTPTPTPSPSPTPPQDCDPSTKPNASCSCGTIPGPIGGPDLPAWICAPCPGAQSVVNYPMYPLTGCDPNKSSISGNCCICNAQNVGCNPGYTWSTYDCACKPDPTPTPIPSPGGGPGGGHGTGGGGGGGGGYPCTEYYWVYYEFSNGHWEEIARWYAGCW
jgi:hypothetical protein